jgi:3-oxoacyl-[acyl-carrier-protein] synthase III
MTELRPIGVISVGAYLPEEVRTNDFWAPDVVEGFRRRSESKVVHGARSDKDELTPSARQIMATMEALRSDPFQGARERRVAPNELTASDMEIAAGKAALTAAGLSPDKVDVLFTSTSTPDFLCVPNACRVHEGLGLSSRCMSSTVEAMCNGFLTQLSIAAPMLACGQGQYALLIQSSLMSRISLVEDQQSAWYGDGATAVLIGPVSKGRGVLGRAHKTDGSYFGGVVCGVPGKRWYDDGQPHAYIHDLARARRMVLGTADLGREVFDAALEQSGLCREEIAFYGSHQAWVWFRPITQEALGIPQARYTDTFAKYGSMLGCNIPISLFEGEQAGKLSPGDPVAMYSGAAGLTCSSLILRWGT